MTTIIAGNRNEVIDSLREVIAKCAKSALAEKKVFRVGLSGGSVVNYLSDAIPDIDTDILRWKFFFCDERYVDRSHPDSTAGAYKSNLIPKTKIDIGQLICIDNSLPLEQCARDYEDKIRKEFNVEKSTIPEFDVLLLGMGPDGHTCSLFPEHKLLAEKNRLIVSISDSPKPPPERVTMTLPLINKARCVVFVICGSEKADVAKRIFVDKEPLPAGLVRPEHGNLICIFDKEAAKCLQ